MSFPSHDCEFSEVLTLLAWGNPECGSVSTSFNFPKEEEKVIAFWREIDAFRTSVKLSEGRPEYTFYDGPPFATGLPHYGHLLAGTIKVSTTICSSQMARDSLAHYHPQLLTGHSNKTCARQRPSCYSKIWLGHARSSCRTRDRQKVRHHRTWRCSQDGDR